MPLIWVTGANGQVGRALTHLIQRNYQQWVVRFFSHTEFDLTDTAGMMKWFQSERPQCVINLAAYTAVDLAESEQELAYAVNASGVEYLAHQCALLEIPIIHVSTDYVFSGYTAEPCSEEAITASLSIYGQSKALGEQFLRNHHTQHVIVRTSWIFSAGRESFVTKILQKAYHQRQLSVVSDQIGCPTSAIHLAMVLCHIAVRVLEERATYGTYHYRDDQVHSWYSFAKQIMGLAAMENGSWQEVQVLPVLSTSYPTIAIRPSYSVLSVEKLIRDYDIFPMSFTSALQNNVRQILEQLIHVSS